MSLRGRKIAPPVNAPPTTDWTASEVIFDEKERKEEGVFYLRTTNHPSIHHFCTGTYILYSGTFLREKTFAFRYKTRISRRKLSRIAPVRPIIM